MFGHCLPVPISEVAFPSIGIKVRNAGKSWGVLGGDLKVLLKQHLLEVLWD